jgi:transcription initiation factor IIE alpha subunit
MDEVCTFISVVYDRDSWICFCLLWHSNEPLTESQLAMRSGLEMRKTRASLVDLNAHGMIERVGAQIHGRWTTQPSITIERITKRLNIVLDTKKSKSDFDSISCERCEWKADIMEVIDQLDGEEFRCPQCGSIISEQDDHEHDQLFQSVQDWIDRIEVFSKTMQDWYANPHRAFLPTPQ